ncbi:MAG TPA: Gfo/Idh/MocA family oxidoreductase [Terriglobales bacterium]|nr:Gfo/Idh/MocA family oxidoreductase [Terriglobales bacterium]
MSGPIPVAVVGCGAFGRHHARIYRQLPQARLVGVYDTDRARAQALAQQHETQVLASLEEVAEQAAAASVAVPTVAHADVASFLFERGLDLLVEKPIAPSLADADRMIAAAARRGRLLMVGHLERFNPVVRLVRARLTRPLFFEVHRLSVFTPRSLDVDVLLDLMIHDLDIVRSFVGAAVTDLQAVGLAVLSRHTDIANVRLSFAGGCVANLTASRVSTEQVRKLRFFQPGEYLSLDYARRDAQVFSVDLKNGMPAIAREQLQGGADEPLALEIAAFLDAAASRRAPEVDGGEARAALELALRAAAAISVHHQILRTASQGAQP